MKKILYMAVAAIAALSSCSSDDFVSSNNNSSNGDAKVFTGTIENDNSVTRSTLTSANKVNWDPADKISINGAVYTVAPNADDATKADFYYQSGTAPTSGPYYAFYADGANTGDGSYDATKHTFNLPASYNYSAGKFNMPMYAYSAESPELAFHNICGVLAVTIPTTGLQLVTKKAVTSISVTSDKAIAGACTIDNSSYEVTMSDGGTKTVTLNLGSGVDVSSEAKTFYLPVPAGDHNLTISVSDGNYSEEISTSSAEIERNTVYAVEFKDATRGTAKTSGGQTVPWVQLWAGGPKFATINVGQTVTDYSTITASTGQYTTANVGGLYTWGGTANSNGGTYTNDYNTGTADLSGDNDTATKLWGSNWRMPTQDELTNLGAGVTISSGKGTGTNCTWTWCNGSTTQYVSGCKLNGYKVSGNTGSKYENNSVFFPAAGCYFATFSYVGSEGSDGFYLSATPNGSDYACYLYFYSGDQRVGNNDRSNGYSVRAVLK